MHRRSLLPALLATALLARADVLPPAQDTSSSNGKLTAAAGKATTLAVSATKKGFVLFNLNSLPVGVQAANIANARLRVYFPSATKPGDIAVHTVTGAWDEKTTAAEPGVSGAAVAQFPAATVVGKKFVEVDVTTTVQAWRTTPATNFGFAFLGSGITSVTVGAKEGSGSGYPCELEVEIDRAVAAGSITTSSGMVLIPAGAFMMGNSVAADTDITNAAPVSTTVSAFFMGVNEVTFSEWRSVYLWAAGNSTYAFSGGSGKGPNHPVQTVNWYDCVKWCNARSEREGRTPVYYTDAGLTAAYRSGEVPVFANWAAKGYRLPTEAEWERAARGGLNGQRFPWGLSIDGNVANYAGNTASFSYDFGPDGYNAVGSVGGTSPATSPVGSFAANRYGLYDVAGNVQEWCWDWYGTPYAGGTDPRGAAAGSGRVLRGGYWDAIAQFCRTAQRVSGIPTIAGSGLGFRVVLAPGQP